MAYIIEGYASIKDYRLDVESKPDKFRPDHCDNCECKILWHHGYYIRGVVRKDANRLIEDPLKILRFICVNCFHTRSTLPEFICPRRWYLWCMQQVVITRIMQGEAINSIANSLALSRSTVYRWRSWILIKHDEYSKELAAIKMGLGMGAPPNKFWLFLFMLGSLSQVMFQLYKLNIRIP